jgi:molecular chaperone DnaK (HSP70)
MPLIGLDLNATRARAIQGENLGSGPHVPLGLPLEGSERELPLAVSLEERQPRVGRAGAGLCRRSPHLTCMDFLPYLGEDRLWTGGRHRLDAATALALVCDHLQRRIGRAEGVTVALPPYFNEAQAALLADVAARARWRLLGSVPSPIAVALAAHEHLPWSGQAVVIDLDDYALTLSAVAVREERVRVLHVHPATRLGRSVWLSRLLDGAALRCIRLSRRDPREVAETEQALFDQLAVVLEGRAGEEPVQLVLQTPHWYQHLKFSPDELSALCALLVQRTLAELHQFLAEVAELGSVGAVLMTGPAARLPGLAAAVEEQIYKPEAEPAIEEESDDFGESLIESDMLAARVHILDEDAVARAAFDLALRQHRGELPRGHVDCVSIPSNNAKERGPTRLPFRGPTDKGSDEWPASAGW